MDKNTIIAKSTRHCANIDEIECIIWQSEFINLTNYTEFNLQLLGDNNIVKIIASNDVQLFKYLINNTLDLEVKICDKWRPIHLCMS